MKHLHFLPKATNLLLLMAVVASLFGSASPVAAATVQTCEAFGLVEINGKNYVVQNNVWGASTAQCISVDNVSGALTVTSSAHNNATNGAPAAYPSIWKGCHWGNCTNNSGMPVQVSAISSATSSWNVTPSSSGAWNIAYDIWFHRTSNVSGQPDGAELMIWINHRGGVQPAGSMVGTVSIAGASWEVWIAQMSWNYIAYRRTTTTNSVSGLDLRPFINDAVSRGSIQSSWFLSGIEAGSEIWQAGSGFRSNSFSAAVSGGGTGNPTPTRTPTGTPVGPTPTRTNTPVGPTPTRTSTPVSGGGACSATYTKTNDWGSGFTADVTVRNNGTSAINGWTVRWTFSGNQNIGNLWNGVLTQSGQSETVRNAGHNGTLSANGTTMFGFQAAYSGTNTNPSLTCTSP